eukprot:jgi/Chlat1/6384/Chrsp44S05758
MAAVGMSPVVGQVLALLLVVVQVVLAATAAVDPASPVPPAGCPWKLVFSDEFRGDRLDTSKWFVDEGANPDNCELEYYTGRASNLFVDQSGGGQLVLKARKEEYEYHHFTSTRINTKFSKSITYGRVQVRAKLPKGKGLWPAIWMLPKPPSPYGGWSTSGELDIMEYKGQFSKSVQATLIYGDRWPYQYYYTSGPTSFSRVPDFSDGYHTFAVEWGLDQIVWYVDGTVYHRQSLNQVLNPPSIKKRACVNYTQQKRYTRWREPFDQPFYLILNLAVGGCYLGGPTASPTWQNSEFRIEHVRIYQRSDKGVSTRDQVQKCFGYTQLDAGWPTKEKTVQDLDNTWGVKSCCYYTCPGLVVDSPN